MDTVIVLVLFALIHSAPTWPFVAGLAFTAMVASDLIILACTTVFALGRLVAWAGFGSFARMAPLAEKSDRPDAYTR